MMNGGDFSRASLVEWVDGNCLLDWGEILALEMVGVRSML